MFNYYYNANNGALILDERKRRGVGIKSARPVFAEELDVFGFNEHFRYNANESRPYMWAEMNSYYYRGFKVARVIGGSLTSKPDLQIYENLFVGSELEPIDVDAMNQANDGAINRLATAATLKIEAFYNAWREKVNGFYASYSGGKDSDVMLDLLLNSAIANNIVVIFGDTGMEARETYRHVEEIKERVKTSFYTAKSELDPIEESWRMFGAPSRTLRWCCNVHKTTPMTLKSRELFGNGKTATFVGVRAEESPRRRNYEVVSDEIKVKSQVAFYPILDWMESEVWAYLFWRNLPFNKLYRFGFNRIGCLVCSQSGFRGDYVRNVCIPEEAEPYRHIINESDAAQTEEIDRYWNSCGWRVRVNGFYLRNNSIRLRYETSDDAIIIRGRYFDSDYHEWFKILGDLTWSESGCDVNYFGMTARIEITTENEWTIFSVRKAKGKLFKQFISDLKKLINRSLFCVGCRTCEANCKQNAITFVKIDNNGGGGEKLCKLENANIAESASLARNEFSCTDAFAPRRDGFRSLDAISKKKGLRLMDANTVDNACIRFRVSILADAYEPNRSMCP